MPERVWPHGRISADDDGEFAVAFAIVRDRIVMQFAEPTAWIGLQPEDADAFADKLHALAAELRAQRGEPGGTR